MSSLFLSSSLTEGCFLGKGFLPLKLTLILPLKQVEAEVDIDRFVQLKDELYHNYIAQERSMQNFLEYNRKMSIRVFYNIEMKIILCLYRTCPFLYCMEQPENFSVYVCRSQV